MKEQTVVIKEYITKVKVSNSRRPIYYPKFGKIPIIYKKNPDRYIYKEKKYSKHAQLLLYDNKKKEFVIKNERFLNKPRTITIGGNMFYAGMHERVRMIIMNAIKNDLQPHIEKLNPIKEFPIHINAILFTIPGMRNWDVDNLWVYIKAFQDLLIEYNIIPDDSVRYITKAPSFEFTPVAELKDRKMMFTIKKDERNITNHVMFASKPTPLFHIKNQYKSIEPVIYLSVEDKISGNVDLNKIGIHYRATMGIGKKELLYATFEKTLKSIRYWSIQYNAAIVIDYNMATEYHNYNRDKFETIIKKTLCNEGINVIIHNTP
jgi:hypothetical protein